MVLSNAERQARHRQRLKDAAASMKLVRFFEGTVDQGSILHDTRMSTVPRVGETVTFRFERHEAETRYEVVAVDYLFEVKGGVKVSDDLVGARVQVKII